MTDGRFHMHLGIQWHSNFIKSVRIHKLYICSHIITRAFLCYINYADYSTMKANILGKAYGFYFKLEPPIWSWKVWCKQTISGLSISRHLAFSKYLGSSPAPSGMNGSFAIDFNNSSDRIFWKTKYPCDIPCDIPSVAESIGKIERDEGILEQRKHQQEK